MIANRQTHDATFDALLQLKDAGPVTADGTGTVGGQARIVDLGAAYVDGRVLVDVTAIEVASGDEAYRLRLQFSDSSTFASGVVNGAELVLGDASVTGSSADSAVGRYTMSFTNEIGQTQYRYCRLWIDVQGAVTTGINFTAFIVK